MKLIEKFLQQWKPETTVKEVLEMIRNDDIDLDKNLCYLTDVYENEIFEEPAN